MRFLCKDCQKSFTYKIKGIDRYSRISNQAKSLIIKEFYKQKSFSLIAQDYRLSINRVMKIFDDEFPIIRRSKLPEAMCIDEIGFKTLDGSYAAIIYDHNKKIVVDVIRNRQSGYLSSYFMNCSFYERKTVKFFISNLYEGYASVKEKYFKDAIHIADMFHVIRLLKVEVLRLRIRTYKNFTMDGDLERYFMKNNWNVFEKYMTYSDLNKPYFSKKEKFEYKTWDIMKRCLSLDMEFWDAYNILQDLLFYHKNKYYEDCLDFIERISHRLVNTGNEELNRVGRTYHQWRYEIANALYYKNELEKRYSNGPAEGLNNAIKTIIKDGNGYQNFERFRKRTLLILNKGKDTES